MTKIIFRSIFHYDVTLANLANKELSLSAEQELDIFVAEIQKLWEGYNDKLFAYYESIGLTLPAVWYVYPIHPNGRVSSFGEPTTILIREDKEEVIATLIHELCHVFCSFDENDLVVSPIWGKLSDAFGYMNEVDRAHILVIALARAGLRKIFGDTKADELLIREKGYEGLEGAWKVLDRHSHLISEDPFVFLNELVRFQAKE